MSAIDDRYNAAFEIWRCGHEERVRAEYEEDMPQYFTPILFEYYLVDAFDEWRWREWGAR